MVAQVHAPWHDRTLRHILARARHDRARGSGELVTGLEGASSRPVRRIVLIDG